MVSSFPDELLDDFFAIDQRLTGSQNPLVVGDVLCCQFRIAEVKVILFPLPRRCEFTPKKTHQGHVNGQESAFAVLDIDKVGNVIHERSQQVTFAS